MKLEREVIIDLLPAYFSGEASAATRALVEEYFREHPDFEKAARSAGGPLEELKIPLSALEAAQEKLAFERARQVSETSTSFLWMAIFFSLMVFAFRIKDHKFVWIIWGQGLQGGVIFVAAAIFMWLLFIGSRGRKEPLRAHTKFLWISIFYTILLATFKITAHRIVFLLFDPDPAVGIILACVALGTWITYFILRHKQKDLE